MKQIITTITLFLCLTFTANAQSYSFEFTAQQHMIYKNYDFDRPSPVSTELVSIYFQKHTNQTTYFVTFWIGNKKMLDNMLFDITGTDSQGRIIFKDMYGNMKFLVKFKNNGNLDLTFIMESGRDELMFVFGRTSVEVY
ncbi:hypothetical protein [Flammeovirga kamogawensis]|uniref:DUF4251 domain-containing protein n=1 Tax=Flammeovirga kamogawensis TaxID=373891 RepID=A0ABX8GTY1_9BACT|nr:hypothetical protein [Flammeovirga kamogawensis]MBB6463325.1 hypothetical protein [Flammeovirga kamogawensis]QWG06702.1 hypothetical protein KM029_15505 [Flammeovirga kamogawensis]TRX68523.1 hypothetical protein EO216_10500 [Flammeovirga kamogawensis]